VVGRGGLLRPMPGGTYKITYKMLDDLIVGFQGQHASNLGGVIAYEIAEKAGIPSYIVDPVAVDEVDEVTRISGMEDISRRSLVHALNIKAVVRKVCADKNLDFEKSNFVVAHIGGGITVSPVRGGRIIDCNNANEDGPFSPERTGGLPVGDLVKLAFSNKYTMQELLILRAMAYQLSKEIGGMATALCGNIDAIILTGGIAYNKRVTNWITEDVKFIAPVEIVPGENEMLALAEGALRVLNGEETPKIYDDEVKFD